MKDLFAEVEASPEQAPPEMPPRKQIIITEEVTTEFSNMVDKQMAVVSEAVGAAKSPSSARAREQTEPAQGNSTEAAPGAPVSSERTQGGTTGATSGASYAPTGGRDECLYYEIGSEAGTENEWTTIHTVEVHDTLEATDEWRPTVAEVCDHIETKK